MTHAFRPLQARFFTKITNAFTTATDSTAHSVLITHLLAERPAFINAVNTLTNIAAILPKPKSINEEALATIAPTFRIDQLSRSDMAQAHYAVDYLRTVLGERPGVLVDIGGYFAPVLTDICQKLSGQILGVVEDTENGHRRYADIDDLPCPVVSVARSPLKQPEDVLVGQSCAFSAEALMRSIGDLPVGRPVAVLGFGKVGRAAADTLRAKGSHVRVFDTDPIRAVQALSAGYSVTNTCTDAIRGACLVLCATGNRSLTADEIAHLTNGAHVATVTSSDDELDLSGARDYYESTTVAPDVQRWETPGHYFYLHNAGNAVNFIHGAVVGDFIYLVQAEILAAIARITQGTLTNNLSSMSADTRRQIAEIWIDNYRSTT